MYRLAHSVAGLVRPITIKVPVGNGRSWLTQRTWPFVGSICKSRLSKKLKKKIALLKRPYVVVDDVSVMLEAVALNFLLLCDESAGMRWSCGSTLSSS